MREKVIILGVNANKACNILNNQQKYICEKFVNGGYKGWIYLYVLKKEPYLISSYSNFGGMYVFKTWEVRENVYKAYIYEKFGIYNGDLGVANGFVVARFFVSGNHSKDKSVKIERLELLKKPLELKDFKTSIQKKSGSLKRLHRWRIVFLKGNKNGLGE